MLSGSVIILMVKIVLQNIDIVYARCGTSLTPLSSIPRFDSSSKRKKQNWTPYNSGVFPTKTQRLTSVVLPRSWLRLPTHLLNFTLYSIRHKVSFCAAAKRVLFANSNNKSKHLSRCCLWSIVFSCVLKLGFCLWISLRSVFMFDQNKKKMDERVCVYRFVDLEICKSENSSIKESFKLTMKSSWHQRHIFK